jgi:hypothetical protein
VAAAAGADADAGDVEMADADGGDDAAVGAGAASGRTIGSGRQAAQGRKSYKEANLSKDQKPRKGEDVVASEPTAKTEDEAWAATELEGQSKANATRRWGCGPWVCAGAWRVAWPRACSQRATRSLLLDTCQHHRAMCRHCRDVFRLLHFAITDAEGEPQPLELRDLAKDKLMLSGACVGCGAGWAGLHRRVVLPVPLLLPRLFCRLRC